MGSSVNDHSDFRGFNDQYSTFAVTPQQNGLVPLPFGFFDYHIKTFH